MSVPYVGLLRPPNKRPFVAPKPLLTQTVSKLTAAEIWSVEEFERAEMRRFELQVDYINKELLRLPGITAFRGESSSRPPMVPEVTVEWDIDAIGKMPKQVGNELFEGNPGIFHIATANGVDFNPLTLQPGEEQAIVARLKQILIAWSTTVQADTETGHDGCPSREKPGLFVETTQRFHTRDRNLVSLSAFSRPVAWW